MGIQLIGIGFWRSFQTKDFPDPGNFEKEVPELERCKLVKYLNRGVQCSDFLSQDWCRYRCNKDAQLKSDYFTDGTYIWPGNLAHYISYHGIYLPDDFINWVKANETRIFNNVGNDYSIDLNWWKDQEGWSSKSTFLYPSDEIEKTLINRKLS